MIFELTDTLADEILSALENQEEKFLVDAGKGALIAAGSVCSDENLFYALPEWNSTEGFRLRKEFADSLHAPDAREDLQQALRSGRGVFKAFKLKLKEYPEVEKLWHFFHHKKMRAFIGVWYNNLREVWNLEKLRQEPDDNGELLLGDFIFQEFNSERDTELILRFLSADSDLFGRDCPGQVRDAVSELWRRQFLCGGAEKQTGLICRTLTDEFAGCITAAPVSERAEETVVITSFFVPKKLRGLGIGTELLTKYLGALRSLKKKWILLTYTIVPDSIQPLLLRSGFQKTGSGFAAEIQES